MNMAIEAEESYLSYLVEQMEKRENFMALLPLQIIDPEKVACPYRYTTLINDIFEVLRLYVSELDSVTRRQWLRQMQINGRPCVDDQFIEWVAVRRREALNVIFSLKRPLEENTLYLYWEEERAHYVFFRSPHEWAGHFCMNQREKKLLRTYQALPWPSVNRLIRRLRHQSIVSPYASFMKKEWKETMDCFLQHKHVFFRFIEAYFLDYLELFTMSKMVDYTRFEAEQKEFIFCKNEMR